MEHILPSTRKKEKCLYWFTNKNSILRVWQVFILKCPHQINISATEPDFYERSLDWLLLSPRLPRIKSDSSAEVDRIRAN